MQSDEPASGDTTRPPGPPRVLVVDDDPAIRLVCSTSLQLGGYQVLEAANGQEGLELAFDHAPDVVLLEISMPVLDGFGLAAALQADERTRELPLIFLTAEDDPLIKAKALETGAHGIIAKPFEPSAVTSFIERVVAQVIPKRRFSVVDP
jgi:two-component system sensor histidine kinase/response regulator